MTKHELEIETRVKEVAFYFVVNKSTIRDTAEHFKMSRMTTYRDIADRLLYIDLDLWCTARNLLVLNKAIGTLKGGDSTKQLWQQTHCFEEIYNTYKDIKTCDCEENINDNELMCNTYTDDKDIVTCEEEI